MNLSRNQHVILLYESDSRRNIATASCINQGLKESQLCIYASVNAYDNSHLSKISSLVDGYQENVANGNLIIVDLKPFYDSALEGDLSPFNEFRTQLGVELKKRSDKRKNRDILVIADCADSLFINQRFDRCEIVENWWHDVYTRWLQQQQQEEMGRSHFTVICPYSASLLGKNPFSHHKDQISLNHSIAIDTEGNIVPGYIRTVKKKSVPQVKLTARVVIAEPDRELRQLYNLWLRSIGFKDITITASGGKCIEELFKLTKFNEQCKNSSNPHQDIILILDTHIEDIPAILVAKEITKVNPSQQIVFTTTTPYDIFSQEIRSAGLYNCDVLTKPFELSKLLSLTGFDTRGTTRN
jgi:CheY-like chemotaxis protein